LRSPAGQKTSSIVSVCLNPPPLEELVEELAIEVEDEADDEAEEDAEEDVDAELALV
jgi:hypothetical protein